MLGDSYVASFVANAFVTGRQCLEEDGGGGVVGEDGLVVVMRERLRRMGLGEERISGVEGEVKIKMVAHVVKQRCC
ncbi:unnamed protein product [Trifolium pratense]|uniref:Uncharacterized protein n=1 Tax=Trifolium pratense TaxID=57577 RepID=A0ACB0K8F0_TRIPR|nr:unnamed protein product [Trifolium pratense]